MITTIILLLLASIGIFIVSRQIRKFSAEKPLPECNFKIKDLRFEVDAPVQVARFVVLTKNRDRYFRDFPIGFKFYSDEKFRSKIRISYNVTGDDEIETIFDKVVEFEDAAKEHIYYINDVIVGSIDIEIFTNTQYGRPKIMFEILQNNMCHMTKEHKLEIVFPE